MTTCSIPVALLVNHYKKDQQKALTKQDEPNKQSYVQKGENGHIQDGDQGNEENGDGDDIDNQGRMLVPHSPNRNCEPPGDCTQNNMMTATIHFGSEVIHREGEASMSQSCS